MSVIMARGRRYGLIAASLLSLTLLAACVGPAPSDPGEQRVDPDTAADIVADPELEFMLDFDDDLGVAYVTPLPDALDDGGLLVTTQFDADAYAEAGNEPLQWLWNVDPYAEPEVRVEDPKAPATPEESDEPEESELPGFRPWLRRYSAEGELAWEVPFTEAVSDDGASIVPMDVPIDQLEYAAFNIPGSGLAGIWSVALRQSVLGLLKEYTLATVDLADGRVLDARGYSVPVDAETGGVGEFALIDGAIISIETVLIDAMNEGPALVRLDPHDLQEPVWIVPLETVYDDIRSVGGLIYLTTEDGSGTLIDAADGQPVAGFEEFGPDQTFREVGGTIIRSVDRDGALYVMRIDELGAELWDAEVEARTWGWTSNELWVMTPGAEQHSATDIRLIDLETGTDVWAEPAAGPFYEVSGATDEAVVLADFVPEADRVGDRSSDSLSVLERATGELLVRHEIDWVRKAFGDKLYYVETVEGNENAVSAFRYGETDPVWTLDIGQGRLVRQGRLLLVLDPDEGEMYRITGTAG